jgi:hypothetical protein
VATIPYAEAAVTNQKVRGTGDKQGLKRQVLGSVAAELAGKVTC